MEHEDEDDDEEEEDEKREIGIDEDYDEEEEDCFEDTCSEEDYPGLKNTGLFGRVVRTLSYLTWGNWVYQITSIAKILWPNVLG